MNPPLVWADVASLPGRRITRQLSAQSLRFCDESGNILVESDRRSRLPVFSEITVERGHFRTVSQRGGDLALEQAPPGGIGEPKIVLNWIKRIGAGLSWYLPTEGTPTTATMSDGEPLPLYPHPPRPFRVLVLTAPNRDRIVSLRFLLPGRRSLRPLFAIGEWKNVLVGEAVLGPGAPDASQILPELMFAFDVLEVENIVPRGGSM